MSRYTCGDQKATSREPDIAFHHEGSEGQIRFSGLVAATFLYGAIPLSLFSKILSLFFRKTTPNYCLPFLLE